MISISGTVNKVPVTQKQIRLILELSQDSAEALRDQLEEMGGLASRISSKLEELLGFSEDFLS